MRIGALEVEGDITEMQLLSESEIRESKDTQEIFSTLNIGGDLKVSVSIPNTDMVKLADILHKVLQQHGIQSTYKVEKVEKYGINTGN